MSVYEKAEDLMQSYKTGDYVFYSVLKRHFHGLAILIGDYLAEKGYVRKDTVCKCPNCCLMMFVMSRRVEEIAPEPLPEEEYCIECDRYFQTSDLHKEPIWIVL